MAEKPTHEEINQKRMLPKASLPQWQTTFDAINDAVCLLDMNGKILRCNKAMQSLLKKSSEEIIGGTCWELVHGTDKPVKGCPIVRMKKTLRRETLVLKVDDKWFNVSVDPVIDETGNLTSAVHIISDITRHKQAEETQRESEEKYRALYKNTPLSYQALNENGCFNDVNSAWIRTLGYDRKEVIGKWFGDFLHPDWKPHFEKNFSEFKRRGYVHDAQFKIRHKDGHFLDISFEGSIGYHPDGSFKQTYCVFQDITERKQAEEALRDSRYMLQTVLDSIPAGVFWKDRDLIYLGGNRTWLEKAGLKSSEEVVGKSDYDLPWDKKQADSFREDDRTVIESGIPKYDIIEPYLQADGTHAWAKTNKVPLRDTEGNVIGVLGTYEDITERKKAEEELQKRMNELETFYRTILGREERVIEMKQEVNELLEQLGKNKKYRDYSKE